MEVKSGLVQKFMKCLQESEAKSQAKIVSDLFTADAKMENLMRPGSVKNAKNHAPSEPEAFWGAYLAAFDHISSHFTHVTETDQTAVLEWESVGSLAMGAPIHYAGVSILVMDGEKLTGFRTYYDSASLTAHIPVKAHSQSTSAPEITNEATS